MQEKTNNITFVTGIWDLQRGSAKEEWARPFDHYISNFIELLKELKHINLVIFIDPDIEYIVWDHRDQNNTKVIHHRKNEFSKDFFPFFDMVQSIRTNEDWYNQAGWLKDSTQGSLEYYNPLVMSKMFMLHNAKCFNPFNSEYFFWIDGGVSNTLSLGYFNNPNVIDNLKSVSDKFLFICFPYETQSEIHGFNIDGMRKYANSNTVNRVARGGFFGGNIEYISEANNLYYSLLDQTLSEGYMGTEESIFTLMTYLDPQTYHHESINEDGLIYLFFEKLQNNTTQKRKPLIDLYINTFHAPQQLVLLLESFKLYEPKFLTDCRLFLLNNSTEDKYSKEYDSICDNFNIKQIKNGNIGICGSRQLASDLFSSSDSDFMIFFEDDMLLDFEGLCPFGFNKKINRLLENLINIMNKEQYDFLKFSFSEFYGHNGQQWSWHNVPLDKKLEYFGPVSQKPNTIFHNIKSLKGIPYADGEIYYSNWPHIIGKEGNTRCFQETKWDHPYEQTWMSHLYTLTKQGKIKPGILLASPITHNRVYHYGANERKEN